MEHPDDRSHQLRKSETKSEERQLDYKAEELCGRRRNCPERSNERKEVRTSKSSRRLLRTPTGTSPTSRDSVHVQTLKPAYKHLRELMD
ncbi:hypothetical protein RB195_011132 [Necator americanus]|uniref:Uncharacterized protein n=1 Tax=Necator americanus TaxID=51031 RepID=A0ABR1D2A0_NECAM